MSKQSLSDSREINYVRAGSGQPVVLIHGIAASLHDWDSLAAQLAENGFETIALDLPGHGESFKPDNIERYRLEIVFDSFVDWIQSLGLSEPVILIGHSLGGYLALEYALRFRDRCLGLVLIDPFYSPEQISFLIRLGYRENLLGAATRRNVPAWFYDMMVDASSFLNPGTYILRHDLPPEVRRQMADNFKRASMGIYNLPFTARNLEPYLPEIDKPVLILYGSRDTTLHPNSFQRMSVLMPRAQVIGLKAGHVPHQSLPHDTNRFILEFISKIKIDHFGTDR